MSQIAWSEDLPAVNLPLPSDPVYPVDRAPSPNDPVPRYSDSIWPVRFFSGNPSMQNVRIHWKTFPSQYVDHFRLVVWVLFNVPIPEELIAQRSAHMVSVLSALRIYHNAMDYRMLGRWMAEQGVKRVPDLNTSLMADYAEYLRSERRVARGTAINHLTAITRLWVAGCQIPELRLTGVPPWVTGNIDDYIPADTSATGENDTQPIKTATISALLSAAIQFVETGAGPILRAVQLARAIYDHTHRHSTGRRDGTAKLRAYLADLKTAGAPFPTKIHNAKLTMDNTYIAYVNGVSLRSVYAWSKEQQVREYAAKHGCPTSVDFTENDLLPASIPLTELPTYVNLLQAACFTIIAYLTGMRPGEVLALEAGSLRPSSQRGGWMLIYSRTFKTARDEYGNHDSKGQLRAAPWVAVAPVVKSIRALEQVVEGNDLLFPSDQHLKNAGRSLGYSTIADGVNRFIEHVNTRTPGAIPDDPAGRVTPMRFRRTLAWHIANQPGGLVALAIQYGHLRTAISEGYASRVRDGIQHMVDFETARSIAIRLNQAAEAMRDGEKVSGPAAQRFVTALHEQTEEFNGIVTSRRQARSLLNNSHLTVFQNDDAFVWCNFNRDTALCMSDVVPNDAATPRLDRCKSHCSNIARTDSQAQRLRYTANEFRREAAAMPRPSAERLLAQAIELDGRADEHERDCRALGDFDAED